MAERVTQAGAVVEYEGSSVIVSQSGALIEYGGSASRISQFGVMIEFEAKEERVSQLLILVEFDIQTLEYYAVYPGHDIPISLLERLNPQPHVSGIYITRRNFSHNRKIKDDFLYCHLEYNIVGSGTIYRSILSQLDLLDNEESDITITLKSKEGLEWTRFNGRAVKPRMGEDIQLERFFPRDIRILVKHLVRSS